jgi:hypothetical protein
MVMVPERCPEFEFAKTVKPTVPGPGPLPDAPESILIQDALLTAVQSQLPVEVTLTMPVLPLTPKFWLVGVRVKVWTVSVTAFEVSLPQELEATKS